MDNLLALEALIVNKLKQDLNGFNQISGMPDLETIKSNVLQFTPACWISWDGDKVESTSAGGMDSKINQRWLVFIVVRNVSELIKGAASRNEAGLLMMQVYRALQGWQPQGYTELVRATAPAPVYSAGLLIAPLAFETTFITTACVA